MIEVSVYIKGEYKAQLDTLEVPRSGDEIELDGRDYRVSKVRYTTKKYQDGYGVKDIQVHIRAKMNNGGNI